MERIAIMQPYFLPYIGYWQLISAVTTFVVYDNIKYTKKGWINRNRYLRNGSDSIFTIPLKNQSDYLHINERMISDSFDIGKICMQIERAYQKAPYFSEVNPFFQSLVEYSSRNLFDFIYHSITQVLSRLRIKTRIIISSQLDIDHSLKAQDKVLAICKHLKADRYINPIGGTDLYSREVFEDNGLELNFIKSKLIPYKQLDNEFIPWLSILDIMMFNSTADIETMLPLYTLI